MSTTSVLKYEQQSEVLLANDVDDIEENGAGEEQGLLSVPSGKERYGGDSALTPRQRAGDATKLQIIIAMMTLQVGALFGVGILDQSIALVSMGFHVLSDVFSYALALWFHKVADSDVSTDEYPFGWARMDVVGGFIGAIALLSGCLLILLEACGSLLHLVAHQEGEVENTVRVTIVAVGSLIVNFIGMGLFQGHGHSHSLGCADDSCSENQNLRAVFVHLAMDALSAMVVAAAAIFMRYAPYDWRFVADPLAAIFCCLLTMWVALPLVKEAGAVLLGRNPFPRAVPEIERKLLQIDEIQEVSEIRVWQHDHSKAGSLVAMLHLRCSVNGPELMPAIKAILAQHGVATSAVELQLASFPEVDNAANEAILAMACNDCDCNDVDCETPQMHWVGGAGARSPFLPR